MESYAENLTRSLAGVEEHLAVGMPRAEMRPQFYRGGDSSTLERPAVHSIPLALHGGALALGTPSCAIAYGCTTHLLRAK